MSIKLKGATSGSIEIDVPADPGGDLSIELPSTGGGQFIVSDSAGNVGIGETSPDEPLHITASDPAIKLQDSDGTDQYSIIKNAGGDTIYDAVNGTGVGGDHIFRAPAGSVNEHVRITSSGSVAIGNPASAADKLHVENGGIRLEKDGGATISYREVSSGDPTLIFRDGKVGADRVKIDNGGRMLVGPNPENTYSNARLQISGSAGYSYISLLNTTGSDGHGDRYSYLNFRGRQSGGEESNLARIAGRHDGSSDDQKGLLEFRTNDGNDGNSGQIRMEIESNGQINMFQTSSTVTSLFQNATSGSFSGNVQVTRTTRSASTGFDFLQAEASSGSDQKFRIRGDGAARADAAYYSGGADYAEYFEWSDGNTTAEDRRGISVVLDGDKIREAVAGEEPIGVISDNPSVVGDSAWNAWSGKYLRDDFGTYILETHNVVSWKETISTEDGQEEIKEHSYEDWNIPADVVVPDDAVISATDENGNAFTHRKLNPDYNPDIEYISREDRPEWETVGLMGKLRIRKGQVTGSRWIKMRDISDTVEEWLVR